MNRDELIQKVVKLMRLADPANGGSEAEVELAAMKIKELMAQHNIDISQVAAAEGKSIAEHIEVTRSPLCEAKGRMPVWASCLGMAVGELCGCTVYQSLDLYPQPSGHNLICKTRLFLVGDKTDIAVARTLFPVLRASIEGHFARAYQGGADQVTKQSYYEGFAERLFRRARKECCLPQGPNARAEATALVKVESAKKAAIQQRVGELGLRTSSLTRRPHQDNSAWQRGWNDGSQVNLATERLIQ